MEHTGSTTMDEQLSEIQAIAEYGWADDGRGSIDVRISPTADSDDIHRVIQIASTFGYTATQTEVRDDGSAQYRLLVSSR